MTKYEEDSLMVYIIIFFIGILACIFLGIYQQSSKGYTLNSDDQCALAGGMQVKTNRGYKCLKLEEIK